MKSTSGQDSPGQGTRRDRFPDVALPPHPSTENPRLSVTLDPGCNPLDSLVSPPVHRTIPDEG